MNPWRKSSWSGSNGGGCLEVARTADRLLIRDTTNRAGGHIDVTPEAWQEFLSTIH